MPATQTKRSPQCTESLSETDQAIVRKVMRAAYKASDDCENGPLSDAFVAIFVDLEDRLEATQ